MRELRYVENGDFHTIKNVKVCTGKFTKSGRPVVEGDIVKVNLYNGKYWIVKWNEDTAGFVLGTLTCNNCAGGSSTPIRPYLLNHKSFEYVSNTTRWFCPKYGIKPGCTGVECKRDSLIPDCHYRKILIACSKEGTKV